MRRREKVAGEIPVGFIDTSLFSYINTYRRKSNTMTLVIVEPDHFDSEPMKETLQDQFPSATIQAFRGAGSFISNQDFNRGATVVIMEQLLPLIGQSATLEADLVQISAQFPGLAKKWDNHDGGERLLRWMRSEGMNMPVIFFTGNDKECIDSSTFEMPNVSHCRKEYRFDNLLQAIHAALKAN